MKQVIRYAFFTLVVVKLQCQWIRDRWDISVVALSTYQFWFLIYQFVVKIDHYWLDLFIYSFKLKFIEGEKVCPKTIQ